MFAAAQDSTDSEFATADSVDEVLDLLSIAVQQEQQSIASFKDFMAVKLNDYK